LSPRDFLILLLVCFSWGLNNVLVKIVVSRFGLPPFAFVTARFAIVLPLVLPWLVPVPRPAWRMIAIGLLMGGGGFVLLALGLRTSTPSSAAIVMQVNVPLTALLSVAMLGERIGRRRGLGILVTLAGALLVIWRPGGFSFSPGLLLVGLGAACGSLGAVMMKQMSEVRPLQFQAWAACASVFPLLAASALFETGQAATALAGGWLLLAAILYAALIGSLVGHTTFYWLVGRYEANLLAPLTLMTPLFTIALGVLVTGDPFDARMVVGGLLAMCGVLLVVARAPRGGREGERPEARAGG
jgi:drug/metabolite transporter (DMT)-like permease